jgi:hypothetical protein
MKDVNIKSAVESTTDSNTNENFGHTKKHKSWTQEQAAFHTRRHHFMRIIEEAGAWILAGLVLLFLLRLLTYLF